LVAPTVDKYTKPIPAGTKKQGDGRLAVLLKNLPLSLKDSKIFLDIFYFVSSRHWSNFRIFLNYVLRGEKIFEHFEQNLTL
jgi:hypothetical protein